MAESNYELRLFYYAARIEARSKSQEARPVRRPHKSKHFSVSPGLPLRQGLPAYAANKTSSINMTARNSNDPHSLIKKLTKSPCFLCFRGSILLPIRPPGRRTRNGSKKISP